MEKLRSLFGKIATVLGFAMIVLLSTAGGPVLAQPIEIVHLNNSAHGAHWRAWLEERRDEFHGMQDAIRIVLSEVPSGYEDRVVTMIAGDVRLDVIESTYMDAGSHAAQGLLHNLRPFMEADPEFDLADYPPQVIQSVTWSDGTLFTMPAAIHLIIAHYRTDLFAEAGLATPNDLGDAFTWDALVEMGRRLTEDRTGDGTIDIYGLQTPRDLFHSQYGLVAQAGGQVFNQYVNPTESQFNSAEVRTALRYLSDLYHTYGVVAPYGQSYLMAHGRAAISLTSGPGWGALNLAPTFGDAWEISQQPAGPGGNGTSFTTTGMQVVRASKHPDAAWEWLKFLIGSYEAVTHFVDRTERMPATISAQPYFVDVVGETTPGAQAYFEALTTPGTTHRPLLKGWSQYSPLIAGPLEQVLSGQLAPDSAAEMMHQRVTAFLKEQGVQ